MHSTLEQFWRRAALILGTGLGLGMAPAAPGTFGSLLGPPMMWGLQQLELGLPVDVLVAVVMFLVGVPICAKAADVFGRKDPGQVVFDEIAAFPLMFLFVPVNWTTGILGFLLFRLFDIWKPWPVRQFERLPGGWGIMADDQIAGVYAAALLWLTFWQFGV